ncbi:PREDICTED: DNA repair protein XRCC2 homolog isoform X2 [Ipomoea nil]|uniref:DNA repair protein XRCC2 homolog isoform X2 n=1 Tax=Ipomoea nil TaxID=35883 RepID=UPI000900E9C8|nr:PREDICTED: DNA repair protein XRCC2 homolog isoform X2 [Ipomoea nil]
MSARDWIGTDETAKQYLSRVLTERPFVPLPPPLHRLPLRAGNIVEIVGPSPSAKTQILIQASINCILPKEWKGVHYGGLERPVMFIDLDCRFDVLSLSGSLKQRILKAKGKSMPCLKEADAIYDKELFAESMRRFLYIRCYDSIQFLATLKTMHHQLQMAKEAHGIGAYLMVIDSIGAFHWMDRASAFMPQGSSNRKSLSLQSVSETVVQEIRKILLVHPMLVLSTKAVSLEDKHASNEVVRNVGKWPAQNSLDSTSVRSRANILPFREYMPSVWQSFVSHRMLVRPSGDSDENKNQLTYFTEWLLPTLKLSEKFIINNDGVFTIDQVHLNVE